MKKGIFCHAMIVLLWLGGCQLNSGSQETGTPEVRSTPDLRGVLVPILEPEDRLYRFDGPELGDFSGLPLNEAGLAKAREYTPETQYLPENQCKPHSPPYIMRSALRWEIVQEPDAVTFNMESFEQVRTVYLDDRAHPPPDARRTPMGHSIGHWEGQTLVVDTSHFEEGYIRRNGAPHSEQAHLTERFIRDGDYLIIMITLEDPIYLLAPFTRVIAHRYVPDLEIRPYPCEVRPPIGG